MKTLLSAFLIVSFVVTSLLGERADADSFQYTAYRKAGRSAWNRAWTPSLLAEIRTNWKGLSSATDLDSYCPGFHAAGSSRNLQEECMVRLLTGISSWESGNRPSASGDGGRSNGLLQINKNNCRPEGYNENDLRTAEKNLRCGVRFAASRIAHDHVIAKEGNGCRPLGHPAHRAPRFRQDGLVHDDEGKAREPRPEPAASRAAEPDRAGDGDVPRSACRQPGRAGSAP